jgi:hypothetical protein
MKAVLWFHFVKGQNKDFICKYAILSQGRSR